MRKIGIVNFENIRSYNNSEYLPVMNRLLEEPVFLQAITSYFTEYTLEELKEQLLSYRAINEFQSNFVCRFIYKIEKQSISQITFKGLENINETKGTRLFISNHRDIVLDSALINFGLDKYKMNTCEIAIGSNLLGIPWVKDLVRLNKSFIVQRNVPKQEMLSSSIQLSSYIQHTLLENNQSVWIAQREGRAKDGNDKTNPGVLKMFALSSTAPSLIDFYKNMNITPVSISYEYDPCDELKIAELIAKEKGETYVKAPNEDVQHMVRGIQGQKGNIKIAFANTINNKIEEFREITNRNEIIKRIAAIIDKEIHLNYHLWVTNYIAFDLINNSAKFKDEYTDEQKETFLTYMKDKLSAVNQNNADAERLFLTMYANPVKNKLEALS
ncbi:MAG: 1-acyl-sn-glycerol-3-phosphate acyltransferase [Flavobacteriales bacterium]|nr:1-acyl-sn-glycerol-3-phosphate acyltransferase [Flavobacteriales bacterium]MCB9363222.1 1-acyl-sn-glycerol-3-phosphate acyltransferase [Flavobacteriales bacterium]